MWGLATTPTMWCVDVCVSRAAMHYSCIVMAMTLILIDDN